MANFRKAAKIALYRLIIFFFFFIAFLKKLQMFETTINFILAQRFSLKKSNK